MHIFRQQSELNRVKLPSFPCCQLPRQTGSRDHDVATVTPAAAAAAPRVNKHSRALEFVTCAFVYSLENMVNRCVAGGCGNSSTTGHRTHTFPSRDSKYFRAWVRFVQQKRQDFSASSVNKRNTVLCGAHFLESDYNEGHLMAYRKGFRSSQRVQLKESAIPTVHAKILVDAKPSTSTSSVLRRTATARKLEVNRVSLLLSYFSLLYIYSSLLLK